MFCKIFALLALAAVAFANPKPDPQILSYSAPAVVPAVGYSGYSPYSAVSYSAPAYAAAPAYPYAYSGYYLR